MGGTARTALGFAFLFAGFLLTWPIGAEMFAMDRCADAGGSYDQNLGHCDFKAVHPSAGMWQRHGAQLLAAFAFGELGFVLLFRRRHLPGVRASAVEVTEDRT